MENFEVPTQSNRLIRYQSNLFQVMLLSRGKLPGKTSRVVWRCAACSLFEKTARTLKDKDFQRELKTIIALFLRDAAMGQHKQDPICGKRVR